MTKVEQTIAVFEKAASEMEVLLRELAKILQNGDDPQEFYLCWDDDSASTPIAYRVEEEGIPKSWQYCIKVREVIE